MAGSMDGTWCTYAEAAARLGLSSAAVRRRAIRGHWARMPGNDGRARILVPEDLVAPPMRTPRAPSDAELPVPALQAHIETLRAQLSQRDEQLAAAVAKAEAGLAAERERSAGHRADYECERDRADQLVADLTSMAARMADAENLKAELAAANERATAAGARADERVSAAEGRAIAAEAQRAAAEVKADQLVADLNSLAARMAEILAEQMAPSPEPEPVRPWWQRWRRRA